MATECPSTTTFDATSRNNNQGGGVKRKHSTVEEEDNDKWCERQSILNMSMTKLQPGRCKTKVESSLRRSVLIFNTLRFLEAQIEQDSPNPAVKPHIAIPPKDICLEPGHTDEVVMVTKEEEKLKQVIIEKQEVKDSTPSSPVVVAPSSEQCQSSEQFLQDTTYILDSLLSSDKVSMNSFSPMIPYSYPGQSEVMWEEPDNMWCSKYDEPFTNWLLNDDLDHIMQVLVSGSAG